MEVDYYKTKESVEEYIELAKDVSGKQLIEKLMDFLPPNSELLELGSGPGTDWTILNKSYDVTGSDNSTEFLKHLTAENPEGKFLNLDAVTLKTDRKFDGIYSNKVMHHLKDSELIESIKRQCDILNSGGVICHSFWKGVGSEVFKGLYVNYFTIQDLKKIFEKSFNILLILTYKEFEDDDSILLIARKK